MRARPKRSMLFVFVTAEEKGLLGSRYFALRPTVPKPSIVANLNFDMALPIFPLRSVTALGAEESSLGAVAAEVGRTTGLPLVPDAFPDRNSFVRSDQYSFIREGVPALITALQNERAGDDVRREAARALGLIGDARAVPALRSALTARDPYLSQIALEALKKLEPAATRPA